MNTVKACLSWVVLSSLYPLCLCGETRSAPPRDELLRLVPADAGFCVVVQDLRSHLARLEQSPFAARLGASRFAQAFREAPEFRKLASLDERLLTNLNVSWAQLRDDILGDAIVLAYRPGRPGRPSEEQGLLLLHARQPRLLADLITRLNEFQRQTGEMIALDRREHRGQVYYHRRKKADGDEFYFLRGALLAFSDKEDQLQAVIDCDRQAQAVDAEPPALTRRFEQLGVERSLFVWWVNPRAFDSALRPKVEQATGAEGAFLRTFARYWYALDGVALFLNVDRDFTGGIAVRARTADLSPAARLLVTDSARPSAVLASVPPNALFMAAGRLPWVPLIDAGGEFLAPDARRSIHDAVERSVGAILGRDVLTEIVRRVGPDWGVWLTLPESAGKHWLPSLTAVLRLRPGENGIPVEQRVLDGLDFGARLAVLAYNAQQLGALRMRSVMQDGIEVRVIDGDHLPVGLQPSFAWKDGYLVLASTPEAVRRFQAPSGPDVRGEDGAEVPLVRLALQGWAGYLRTYRGPVAASLADACKLTPGEANAHIDRWLEGLDLFDTIELTQRATAGRATLTLRLKTLPK
jgi:hypothetical protein